MSDIEVIPATPDQQPILANLLELYVYDFSESLDLELGADGRFGYKKLPLYWREPNRHPFLVKVDGKIAGLVLVKRGSEISGDETTWDMAEFFVVRRHRRHGIGTDIAQEIWRRYPGHWEVRVMESNPAGRKFWERATSKFTGKPIRSIQIEKGGKSWHVFSFESRHT